MRSMFLWRMVVTFSNIFLLVGIIRPTSTAHHHVALLDAVIVVWAEQNDRMNAPHAYLQL